MYIIFRDIGPPISISNTHTNIYISTIGKSEDSRPVSNVFYLNEHDFVVGLQASGSHRVRPQICLPQGNRGEVLFGRESGERLRRQRRVFAYDQSSVIKLWRWGCSSSCCGGGCNSCFGYSCFGCSCCCVCGRCCVCGSCCLW